MIHALVAIAIQAFTGLLFHNWWVGGVFAVGIFMGREHAQAEYRWIERYGFGRRVNMPWYGGFDPNVWNLKSLADFVLPALAVAAIISLLA